MIKDISNGFVILSWDFCAGLKPIEKSLNIMDVVEKRPHIFLTKSYINSYCGPRLGIFVVRNTLC